MTDNKQTFIFALKKSLPVLFGYLFLGSAFGIMLYDAGYNFLWAIFISIVVYAGSGQFLLVSLLSSAASLPTVIIMTLFINSRHMFYGLSYIDKFRQGKWRYPFMIFTLTDETYSVNTSFSTVPKGVDEVKARFLIGEFDHLYWIVGSIIGSLAGQIIPIDFTGIDFSMTALFVIIFIDLILDKKGRMKLVGPIGILCAVICLIAIGADKFLLPTLIITTALLLIAKPYFNKAEKRSPSAVKSIMITLAAAALTALTLLFPSSVSDSHMDMTLPPKQTIIIILVAAVCTFATRLFPFALFGGKKEVPEVVKYLGNILPVAIIGVLIVYCLRDFTGGDKNIILPQIIAVAATALIHIWKRNTLLSIAVGTIGYMLLIHFVFV